LPERLVLGGAPGQTYWANRNSEGKHHAVITLPSCLHCPHLHPSSQPQIVDAYFWQSCTGQQAVEVIQKTLGGEKVTRCRAEDEILVVPLLTCVCAPLLLVLPVAKKHPHDKGRNRHCTPTLLRLGCLCHRLASCRENSALHLEHVSLKVNVTPLQCQGL